MKFVDRIDESSRLEVALSGESPSFVVVYGRRRLGKSTLIKKVLKSSDVYYMADQTEASHQINLLAQEISALFEGFGNVIYPNWNALFDTLNIRAGERFTLCLDEFPYLVKNSPELPSILQKLIDSRKLKYNIIICGSSQQLMKGLILDSSSPLYGRANQIIKLSPINIKYLQEVLECTPTQAIEEYSIWGGVPRYWEIRLQNNSLQDALSYNLLNSQGILYEEPYRLFVDDMRDIVQASTLLALIGNGASRLSEIAARANKPATSLSGPLEKLISLGYLDRDIPFGENPKNSKKGLYKIADPFMDFYFRFVVPNRSLIELGRTEAIMEVVNPGFNSYISRHWENLCRKAVSGQEIMGKRYNIASRWWGNISREEQMEIDLIAESADGKSLLVGECKWMDNENVNHLLNILSEKANRLPFASGKKIVPVIFLKSNKKTADYIFTPEKILDII
ncbi:MAG TPA: ATP-binding protein [Lentimicrobium sp.]|nr:ATP-binding protein [Lentimicrobium sp.]